MTPTTGTSSPADPAAPVVLTRTQGAAFAPAPTPDGTALFYLDLTPDGLDLRRLALTGRPSLPPPTAATVAADLAPALRPPSPPVPPLFAESAVPPGRAYGAGRQEVLPLFNVDASSAGVATSLGVRSGDVLGRLELLATGTYSAQGWPEGGAIAAAFRGLPLDLSFHLFSSRERPSRQSNGVPPGAAALDLDRRGGELGAVWRRRAGGGRIDLHAGLLWEEVSPRTGGPAGPPAPPAHREVGSLGGTYSLLFTHGPWRAAPELSAHYEAGATGGTSWERYGGTAGLDLGYDRSRLALAWRRDGSHALLRPFDRYQLGGPESSLLPEGDITGQIPVPGLPWAAATGARHESQRIELTAAFLPLPLFYERHRLTARAGGSSGSTGSWISLTGLEYRFSIAPFPVARTPALDLRLGLARVHGERIGDKTADQTRWWLVTVWRP